jgi:Leucine-rich repeat (LRR) protein
LIRRKLTSVPRANTTFVGAGVFGSMTGLEEIDLSNNSIYSIPEDLFSSLSSLRVIKLDDNQISSFPERLISGMWHLEYLSFKGNSMLKCFPPNLHRVQARLRCLAFKRRGQVASGMRRQGP